MRKYDIKGLNGLAKTASDKAETARNIRATLQEKLSVFDSAESQRKYTAAHIDQQKSQLRATAVQNSREVETALSDLTKQARSEVAEWTKEKLIMDKYLDSDATDRATRALELNTSAMNRLEISNRLARLNDDKFSAFVEDAVERKDGFLLTIAAQEGEIRGGLPGMRARQAVDNIACPEAEEAASAYEELAESIQEINAIANNLERPSDNQSYAQIRSLEIKRQAQN